MAGVQKRERATLRIEFGVEESDESIRRNALNQITVDCDYRLHYRVIRVGLRVYRSVQR